MKQLCTCGADCDFGPDGCSDVIKVVGTKNDDWVHSCFNHIEKARVISGENFLDPQNWEKPGP